MTLTEHFKLVGLILAFWLAGCWIYARIRIWRRHL